MLTNKKNHCKWKSKLNYQYHPVLDILMMKDKNCSSSPTITKLHRLFRFYVGWMSFKWFLNSCKLSSVPNLHKWHLNLKCALRARLTFCFCTTSTSDGTIISCSRIYTTGSRKAEWRTLKTIASCDNNLDIKSNHFLLKSSSFRFILHHLLFL